MRLLAIIFGVTSLELLKENKLRMKRQLFFLILAFTTTLVLAQHKAGISYATFHGCEDHCGVYETEEYKTLGEIKWKFKTAGKVFSSPAIYNGYAFIGSEDKNLYA